MFVGVGRTSRVQLGTAQPMASWPPRPAAQLHTIPPEATTKPSPRQHSTSQLTPHPHSTHSTPQDAVLSAVPLTAPLPPPPVLRSRSTTTTSSPPATLSSSRASRDPSRPRPSRRSRTARTRRRRSRSSSRSATWPARTGGSSPPSASEQLAPQCV